MVQIIAPNCAVSFRPINGISLPPLPGDHGELTVTPFFLPAGAWIQGTGSARGSLRTLTVSPGEKCVLFRDQGLHSAEVIFCGNVTSTQTLNRINSASTL